jgi:hypothetical protein
MHAALIMVGWGCAAGTFCIWCVAAFWCWLFRDGMKLGFVPSSGVTALARFWTDFRVPLLYGLPIFVLGAFCLWLAWRRERRT